MSEQNGKLFTSGRDIAGLIVVLVICLGVSALGGLITATNVGSWYQGLERPPFNPPDWLFAPVWTVLYISMAVAAWRVWRAAGFDTRGKALVVFAVQLGLNLLWSFLFFGLQRIDLALIEILILLVVIIVNTAMFWRIDRLAGMLFVPYVLWVGFATMLNASLWWLN
jgi:tryptophan-rich sensory protein